jgi:hypothetical protein
LARCHARCQTARDCAAAVAATLDQYGLERTFVLEGKEERSNIGSLLMIKARSKNPLVTFFPVEGRNHFDILAPANKFLASQIIRPWSRGPVELSEEAVVRAVAKQ